jgi:hypothetical protein
MSAYVIERPVWRRFRPTFAARAAAHVRHGGHAAIVHKTGRVDLLLTVGDDKKITELGLWSLLAIEQRRWRRVKVGAAKGLATARVAPKFTGSVIDWCDRDSIHEGPTRTIHLDCLDCGACCHTANVVMDEADLDRFREGGRPDLVHKDLHQALARRPHHAALRAEREVPAPRRGHQVRHLPHPPRQLPRVRGRERGLPRRARGHAEAARRRLGRGPRRPGLTASVQ